MKFKRFLSTLLAFAMLLGMVGVGVIAEPAAEPQFNTVTDFTQVDTTGVTQYYLSAVDGEGNRYFFKNAGVGSQPYSLAVTTDLAAAQAQGILPAGGDAFRTQYIVGKDDLGVYIQVKGAGKSGATDTNGNITANYKLLWDEENDLIYRTVNGEDMCLALAYHPVSNTWRFMAVSKADVLAGTYNNNPVYPVQLVTLEAHAFGTEYNETEHWEECACGVKKNVAEHNLTVDNSNSSVIVIDGCTFTTACIDVESAASVEIKNSTFNTTGYAVRANAVPVKVTDTEFTSTSSDVLVNNGIADWTFSGDVKVNGEPVQ